MKYCDECAKKHDLQPAPICTWGKCDICNKEYLVTEIAVNKNTSTLNKKASN